MAEEEERGRGHISHYTAYTYLDKKEGAKDNNSTRRRGREFMTKCIVVRMTEAAVVLCDR